MRLDSFSREFDARSHVWDYPAHGQGLAWEPRVRAAVVCTAVELHGFQRCSGIGLRVTFTAGQRGENELEHDRRSHIETKLRLELEASEIEVIDESHLHAGHVGAREGGGHFKVTIVSPHFAGLNRVQAQRLVYKILEDEMKSEIHALSIKASAPATGRV